MGFLTGKSIWVKSAGVWKQTSAVKAKDSGTIKSAKEVWVKNSGSWVQVTNRAPSFSRVSITGTEAGSLYFNAKIDSHDLSTTVVAKYYNKSSLPYVYYDWDSAFPTTITSGESSFAAEESPWNQTSSYVYYVEASNSAGTTRYYVQGP